LRVSNRKEIHEMAKLGKQKNGRRGERKWMYSVITVDVSVDTCQQITDPLERI
jgi:hypothetical protein